MITALLIYLLDWFRSATARKEPCKTCGRKVKLNRFILWSAGLNMVFINPCDDCLWFAMNNKLPGALDAWRRVIGKAK